MRIDLAQSVKVGDTVYNCFMDKLVVSSILKEVGSNGAFDRIVFSTVDTRLHNASYDPADIYFEDLYGESDDEKSWVEWAKNNRDFLYTFDHIETTKEIYKTGFCNGFEHKRKMSYEEMMQK